MMEYKDPKELEHELHVACFALIALSLMVIGVFAYLRPSMTGLAVLDGMAAGSAGQGMSVQGALDAGLGDGSGVQDEGMQADRAPASAQEALEALMEASRAVDDVKAGNISRYYFPDLLLKAEQSFIGMGQRPPEGLTPSAEVEVFLVQLNQTLERMPLAGIVPQNFTETVLQSRAILREIKSMLALQQGIRDAYETVSRLQAKGVNTTVALEMAAGAQDEFDAERFGEASSILVSVHQELRRSESEFDQLAELQRVAKNPIRTYGPVIVVGLAVLLVLCIPLVRTVLKRRSSGKDVEMAKDLRVLEGLMRQAKKQSGTANRMQRPSSSVQRSSDGEGVGQRLMRR